MNEAMEKTRELVAALNERIKELETEVARLRGALQCIAGGYGDVWPHNFARKVLAHKGGGDDSKRSD